MRKTKITEADKLKEARAKAARYSRFCDEELAKGRDNFDRAMYAAAMDSWQSATREVHRIEMDERLARIKKEGEQMEREEYNRVITETVCISE
jgi:hypothetical protein